MTIIALDADAWDRICEGCGGPYRRRPGQRRRRFCTQSCGARASAAVRLGPGPVNPNWRGGKTKHPLCQIYTEMVARCHRPTHARYADYGGRGIEVCQAWRDDFWSFVADVGERPPGVSPAGRSLWSLDRIDNDGNYEPGNTRWATAAQQGRNARPSHLSRTRNPQGQFA